eukprot:TRINITY_DN46827_c0_g1_i1.p1 TRINITY_DN46827_c0_g1~~TRINITY_DN46827_c0_g1_i1.p1  ORF type:complete len:148 (-),score=18.72 TRINITY_DN46827_c0_g1_i1:52-495(-)
MGLEATFDRSTEGAGYARPIYKAGSFIKSSRPRPASMGADLRRGSLMQGLDPVDKPLRMSASMLSNASAWGDSHGCGLGRYGCVPRAARGSAGAYGGRGPLNAVSRIESTLQSVDGSAHYRQDLTRIPSQSDTKPRFKPWKECWGDG